MYLRGSVLFSGIREKLHSRNLPVVLHVRLRVSLLHTGAIPEGERVTAPIAMHTNRCLILTLEGQEHTIIDITFSVHMFTMTQ